MIAVSFDTEESPNTTCASHITHNKQLTTRDKTIKEFL